ncbi:unnamed protein product, partial [Meganyctiphanes norvegica]
RGSHSVSMQQLCLAFCVFVSQQVLANPNKKYQHSKRMFNIDCGAEYNTNRGTIRHPLSGGCYLNNEACTWIIRATTHIQITFSSFDVEANYDYLNLEDGEIMGSPLLGRFTGSSVPSPVYTSTHAAHLIFTSDGSVNGTGFELHWEPLGCVEPFVSIGDFCYYFSYSNNVSRNWKEARTYCHIFGDTDLAVFDKAPEDYRKIFQYLSDNGVIHNYLHVGAFDEHSDGSWKFVDSRLVDMAAPYWGHKEPVNHDTDLNHACLFHEDSDFDYRWKMGDCRDGDSYFICQQDIVSIT